MCVIKRFWAILYLQCNCGFVYFLITISFCCAPIFSQKFTDFENYRYTAFLGVKISKNALKFCRNLQPPSWLINIEKDSVALHIETWLDEILNSK